MLEPFFNIGHRGSPLRAPENTIAAFLQAQLDGANWVEFDVRLSADKELVVIHDSKLNRTAQKSGVVKNMTLKQLKLHEVGSWFHEDYADEKIPTLEEVFQALPYMGFNIEIKASGLEKPLALLLQKYPQHQILVTCFMFQPLRNLKKLMPNINMGILFQRRLGWKRKLDLAKKFGFYSIHPEQTQITDDMLMYAQKLDLEVIPWNILPYHEGRLRQLLSLPIRGLINDMPLAIVHHQELLRISRSST
jgi:glycerophosphoryl diester phosphodiesterase